MRLTWIGSAALLVMACAPDPASIGVPESAPVVETSDAPESPSVDESPSEPVEDPPAGTPAATPEAPGDPLHGIDVSHFQGEVDWAKVKSAGIAFAFIKATEGITYTDPKFAANWQGAKDAGVVRGAYAFYVAGDDPAKQAAHFMATVRMESGDLPPVVDIETKGASTEADAPVTADLHDYLRALEKATGVKSIIYTSPGFWNAHFDDSFGAYPLWVAEYEIEEPNAVNGWDGWTFWQHSQGGTVDGVPGKVDLDSFAESASSLKGLSLP
jgi:lysozyme